MPGCVLRASGDNFQVDDFLSGSSLRSINTFHEGQPKSPGRLWSSTGITVNVSDASGDDFTQQVSDAIEFLRSNRHELQRLRSAEGLDYLGMDFGVNRRDVFGQFISFPAELVALAGELGLGLEVSIYGLDENS